jgi:predicted nucleic acid-binding protein
VTFFVDANVFIYSAAPSEYRDPCLEVLAAIARGEADGRTSTAALEEVWHAELSGRVGELDGLTERAYTAMTPLLAIGDETFRLALSVDAPNLGANDRLHVATCTANGIDVMLSADRGFDAHRGLRRVDPLDRRARRRLLAS